MKLWKKILLEIGIFLAVFALGAGVGFIACYQKTDTNKEIKADIQESIPETAADKFMSNLTSAQALEAETLTLSLTNTKPTTRAGLPKIELPDDININISNLQISIADFDNIKVQGDLNFQMSGLDLNLTVGYFDNAIYVDYADTHLYMNTDDFSDIMDLLPVLGVDFQLPNMNFISFDLDSIIDSLSQMEETVTETEHYFMFDFTDTVHIKFLTNENYEMLGVDVIDSSFLGVYIEAHSDLHTLKEDIETLVNPSTVEGAPRYMEIKPAFNLIKDVVNLVNEKKGHIVYDVDIDRRSDNSDFLALTGDLDFDINTLEVFASVNVQEATRSYSLTAGYKDETIYASLRDLHISITNQSVITLMEFISNKVESFDVDVEEVLDTLGSVGEEFDLKEIIPYVNDLPEFISNLDLSSENLSFTFNPQYFGLEVSPFDISINYDADAIKSVSVSGLAYDDYIINASLALSEYQPIEINPDHYVAVDPALCLLDSFDSLINQNKFGINFNIDIDDHDETTNNVNLNGQFEFGLKEAEVEVDGEVVNKRVFDYGAGLLNITDGDLYPHRIVVDAKQEGKVLLSYSGTSGNKTKAKINNSTFDDIFEIVSEVMDAKDAHFMELFGNLMDQSAKTPLDAIFKGEYGVLLDTDIITSLDVTADKIIVGLNGALIGMDELNFDLTLRYSEEGVEGIDISGLEISGNTISLTADLYDFSDEIYGQYSMNDDGSFIDLSTLSLFLRMGLDTSEFNYYYFEGDITMQVGSLFDAITLPAQVQIQNDNGHVRMIAHIEAPTGILLAAFIQDYAINLERNSYLMYDNQDGGMFHLYRHDYRASGFLQSEIDKELKRRYTTDYFMDNILEILLCGMVGLNQSTYNRIGNMNTGEGQIQYENIVEAYSYSSSEKKFNFGINVGELLKSDSLDSLTLDVYHNNSGIFNRAVIDMEIKVLITLHLHLDMDLTGTVEINDQQVAFMTNYVASNGNVTLNQSIF